MLTIRSVGTKIACFQNLKQAYDEIEKLYENQPWLKVDNDFVSGSNLPDAQGNSFVELQKNLMRQRGWDWFKDALRMRFFPNLNLVTVTSWERERHPEKGDPSVDKVKEQFPGATIVSLIGKPHLITGYISPKILNQIDRIASNRQWHFNYKLANNGSFLIKWMNLVWGLTIPVAASIVTWLITQGISLNKLEQQVAQNPRITLNEILSQNDTLDPLQNSQNFQEIKLDTSQKVVTIPRGIRNNNPGNIERNKIQWTGISDNQEDNRFVSFKSPEFGIRAMARILRNYQRKYNLRTISQILKRWAPDSENQTNSYIQYVSRQMDVASDMPLNLENDAQIAYLIKAMIKYENGKNYYSDSMIDRGIFLEKQ